MGIDISSCSSIEGLVSALSPIMHYFGAKPSQEDSERWLRNLDVTRMHAARIGDTVVGGAGAFTFELTVPGGIVPAAGVTVVGVQPTHRRRGILRAMMRAQLDDFRRRNEPIAYLWASEETIYGRFGYGMASLSGTIDLPKSASSFSRPFEARGQLELVDENRALELFPSVYDRIRIETPGMFSRTEDWWAVRRLSDPENRRRGAGVLNRVVLMLDGRPEGYALYRIHQSLESGISSGFVQVIEALGTSIQATAEVWRFLLDIDWTTRIRATLLPVDHPLWFLLARPRLMSFTLGDALWVRLVDVPGALAARTIAMGEPMVLEVVDTFCPWNEGRYRVGAGAVERTDAAADLRLDVGSLGSVYLGGFGFSQLARAGRIEERSANAARRADALFPRNRMPSCPEIF